MKHLLTAIACCLAVAGSAQTWNPDADFDNVIGVEDLMALLSVFGTEWTAEYPQDPEYDLAAYNAGMMELFDCVRECNSNGAKVISGFEYAIFQDSILTANVEPDQFELWYRNENANGGFSHIQITGDGSWFYSNPDPSYNSIYHYDKLCICAGLVPAVE